MEQLGVAINSDPYTRVSKLKPAYNIPISGDREQLGLWPASQTETREWVSTLGGLSGRQRSKILPTYEAGITPAIAAVESIDISGGAAADLAEAEAAIERFDEGVGNALAGFAVIALRTEAVASSRIENLSASATSIVLAEHLPRTAKARTNAEAISANVATLREAMERETSTTPDEIIEIQRVLLEEHAPSLTGQFRQEQVWIGGTNYSPHGADYVAPHHERIPAAIKDWAAFADRRDLGRLAHLAVAHAHFENIHPFPDGNGRTGRVVVQRMLRRSGLTNKTILPISAGLLTDTHRYFEALSEYRNGYVEPIVSVFSEATFATVANAQTLAADLADIRKGWQDTIKARRDSAVWPLLDYALRSPALKVASVAADLGIPEHRARTAIDLLIDAGLLHTNSTSRRNRVWLVPEVLSAVEDFMERTRRPRIG